MKKIYFNSLTLMLCGTVAFAQTKSTGKMLPMNQTSKHITKTVRSNERAVGDTIMYFPLPGVIADSADIATFSLVTEDMDGLQPNNSGAPMDFALYSSTNADTNSLGQPLGSNYYQAWEDSAAGDTAFFLGATSWFSPAGQSNNWAMFGPVTIPAGGANLSWYDRTNPAYRDGYRVWVVNSIAGTEPASIDFENGTAIGTVIFERPDAYPSPTYATDTTWVQRTAAIWGVTPGAQVWFGFQHKSNDMDVLYLDEFLVTEAANVGMQTNESADFNVAQNRPNPCNNQTNIQISLNTTSNVNLFVTDLAGRTVKQVVNQQMAAGTHNIQLSTEDFAAGAYNYTVSANGKSITKKMFVTK